MCGKILCEAVMKGFMIIEFFKHTKPVVNRDPMFFQNIAYSFSFVTRRDLDFQVMIPSMHDKVQIEVRRNDRGPCCASYAPDHEHFHPFHVLIGNIASDLRMRQAVQFDTVFR